VLLSDAFMPLALAERVHDLLRALPPHAWEVRRSRDPDYRFHCLRMNHIAGCECAACTAVAYLAAPSTCAALADAIGAGSLAPNGCLITWYDHGDYLEPHTDAQNGAIAFVWNLAKRWRYEYGGALHVVGGSVVTHIEVPAFNRFVVLDVSDQRTPHFVSPVSAASGDDRRFAISGWYRSAGRPARSLA
jgi:Rps23 Pro-64 3,4-dihydroxylase Tpa1-like proline 4-hydroxylase